MARLGGIRTKGRITTSGPFFARDPGDTFSRNAAKMMEAFAREGETEARTRIRSIPPAGVRTGRTRSKLLGRAKAIAGRPWRATAIVGIPRIQAGPDPIATYAALARIESAAHPMRATTNALRRARAVNTAELTKGLG